MTTATIQQLRASGRDEHGVEDGCTFVPAHEPWSCSTHLGGHRSMLTQVECSTVILRAAAVRSALREAVVDAAVAWAEHPTPANIGALHAAVEDHRRGLDTAE